MGYVRAIDAEKTDTYGYISKEKTEVRHPTGNFDRAVTCTGAMKYWSGVSQWLDCVVTTTICYLSLQSQLPKDTGSLPSRKRLLSIGNFV